MNFEELKVVSKPFFIREEGDRRQPYDDATGMKIVAPVGNVTVGIGYNSDANPFSDAVVHLMFEEQLRAANDTLIRIFGMSYINTLSVNRRIALCSMVYQLGAGNFQEFSKTIAYLRAEMWKEAAREAMNSQWARNFTQRASKTAQMIERG